MNEVMKHGSFCVLWRLIFTCEMIVFFRWLFKQVYLLNVQMTVSDSQAFQICIILLLMLLLKQDSYLNSRVKFSLSLICWTIMFTVLYGF